MKNITPPTEQDTATVKFSWKANSRQARTQRPNNFREDAWQSHVVPVAPLKAILPHSETLKAVLWTLTRTQVLVSSQEALMEAYSEHFAVDGDYYSWLEEMSDRQVFVFSEQELLDIIATAQAERKDRIWNV